jgi:UDP-N-acetyl-D-galactosamine dehydrogenase
MKKKYNICIIGLGYVGMPLALEFSKKFKTYGFDIDKNRVNSLNNFSDNTLEISDAALKENLEIDKKKFNKKKNGLFLTSYLDDIVDANFYIITVPTPVNKYNNPDLSYLISASKLVASKLKYGDIIVYESTVYPGATEEECIPVLEKHSNLIFNKDFFVGYSPERIVPGSNNKKLVDIVKITSGSTDQSSEVIDLIYSSIINVGTFKAKSIKVAEAAKVIENAQRDVNISFVNEISKIFTLLNIDTNDVLEAAGTKWNFLNFKPGLVGGHCIGIDPFYLAQKAQEINFYPEMILTARRINDSMSSFVASRIIKLMINNNVKIKDSKVLILGVSFKENCTDIRNTKIVDLYNNLIDFGVKIDLFDPWVDPSDLKLEYNLKLLENLENKKYDAIVVAVPHSKFKNLNLDILKNKNCVVYDIKGFLKDKYDESL